MKGQEDRFFFFLGASFLVIIGFVIRLLYLQVFQYDTLVLKSQNQVKKIIKIYSHRGRIYDRNGKPLAMSKHAYSVYAVPYAIKDKANFSEKVSLLLGVSKKSIIKKISSSGSFVWLKRKVNPDKVKQLRALKLVGINFIQEEKRVYPNNILASDVLGFVGTDGGLGGLEYQYESVLTGSSGKLVIEGDPLGRRFVGGGAVLTGRPTGYKQGVQRFEPASFDGGHLHTTLDETIQYIAERALQKGIEATKAKKGHVVVMDPHTGDILAMADYPSYDPNFFYRSYPHTLKNSSVVDILEPGSIFKLFTVAAAIEEGLLSPMKKIKVPEIYQLANRVIKESHDRKEGESDIKTVSEILEESLNVGTTLIALELGEKRFYRYMKAFGFGQQTGVHLPGESGGLLRPLSKWSAVDIGMISFGQGIGVTPIQIAAGLSVFANGGKLMAPRIIKYTSDYEGVSIKATPKKMVRQVIQKETATKLLSMMESVVVKGTGTPVRIPGYRIGGKTGTAQIPGPGGYRKDEYIASFIGVLPISQPKLAIVVHVVSPKTQIWGSTVAGPIFKEIAQKSIDYLNIPPDLKELP